MTSQKSPDLTDFSHELLCHILQYLPLKKILSISMLCKKLSSAVAMHLRLCKDIDFCEGKIYDYMPSCITDDHMHALLKKCPNLETVYGLHPLEVERRRLRKRSALTVPGIIEALSLCCNLKSIETSDLRLLEAIMQHLPQLDIIGHFQNRDGVFPPHASQRLKLQPYPRISSLHLIGVEVPELTAMPHLEHLHLQCVRFTKLQPFRAFLAQNLKTFVMKHCMGPSLSLRYLSLIIALSSSPSLTRLELVRVPLPGGLFQRAVEDSYRHNGFVNLKSLVISGCKGVVEADLGHLMIVASKNLESIFIQPSLTRDSLFVSLSFAQCEFPKLKNVHLGFMDKLNSGGEWSNEVLLSLGLAEVPDTPSSLTDSGMKVISQLFPNIKSMSISNCPHLMAMDLWSHVDGEQAWKELTDLTLQRCHCLQLPSFGLFLAFLPKIEVVILNDMFREPPKGCSHVGLSAGTGLGMSSAVVSNQDEHIAVQGPQQDFELQQDEHMENDEMDRDFIDIENDENPDQHIMVLQQEFFDEENHIVPAPVVQRDNINPEHRIENMEQEVPENRIRRELNEDYDVEFRQLSDNEDRRNVSSGHSQPSTSDDDNIDGAVKNKSSKKSKKKCSRHRTRKCSKEKPKRKGNSHKAPKRASQSCISSESSDDNEIMDVESIDPDQKEVVVDVEKIDPDQKEVVEVESVVFEQPIKNENSLDNFLESSDSEPPPETRRIVRGKSIQIKKEIDMHKRECHHAKECRNKCSKGFDPNQPSTSKGGNCPDCTCADFDTGAKHYQPLEIESRTSNKKCRKGCNNNSGVSKKRKLDTSETSDIDETPCVHTDIGTRVRRGKHETNNVTDEMPRGPLTRQRKRALDTSIVEPAPRLRRSCTRPSSIQKGNAPESTSQNAQIKQETPSCSKTSQEESEYKSESGKEESDNDRICTCPVDTEITSRIEQNTQEKPSCPMALRKISEYEFKSGKKDGENDPHNDINCTCPVKIEKDEAKPSSKNECPVEKDESSKVRKHKHKHKRCKKGKKFRKGSHRIRPVTRSHREQFNREDYNIVNQGTQATSADIRRSLRRQKTCSRRRGSDHCRNHHQSHSAISTRQMLKRPKQSKSNVVTHNKSTSTSDPLMENDAVQTLRLVSETLISLTIISCGISDVVIDHCHSMTHVEVQACRILKMFQMHYCPSLKRMSVSQCPKLTLEAIIPEVISLVATRKLLISFEPCMQMHSPAEREKAIFSKAPLDQGIILFHDFTSSANESTQAAFKEYLLRWMEAVQRLYYTPSFWLAKQKKRKSKTKEAKTRYPYGHYLRRIHGVYTLPLSVDPNGTKWQYQILTNDHVFASALEKVPWDKGFPPPETAEDYNEDDALISMLETEFNEKNLKMQKKLITFYIPVSENAS